MKVLWFSLTPSRYKGAKGLGYNGGGWISALEAEIVKYSNLDLGIAFMANGQPKKSIQNSVTFYPMPYPKKKLVSKIQYYFNYSVKDEVAPYLAIFKEVVDDFKPDIIQIFGSEGYLGFVTQVTDVPCVLHIQGVLNPYWNAYFPPTVSKYSYLFSTLDITGVINRWKDINTWKRSCIRECELLKNVKNYIGRTSWDECIAKEFNPYSHYYYGSEILRPSFYQAGEHVAPDKLTIVSTMSGVMYKGFDVVLKTAYILKNKLHREFVWKVYGAKDSFLFFETFTKINHVDVNVHLMGVCGESEICDALSHATVFALTSYIENSPNCVCEAQLVGCPVVATHVGGVASLIDNGITGLLVPANDPYQLAWNICKLFDDKIMSSNMSLESVKKALLRHDRKKITAQLLKLYDNILAANVKE